MPRLLFALLGGEPPRTSGALLAHLAAFDPGLARGSLRFSLGCSSTSDDVDRVIEVLPAALERASRAATPRLRRTR